MPLLVRHVVAVPHFNLVSVGHVTSAKVHALRTHTAIVDKLQRPDLVVVNVVSEELL
jgi:hypothetical protein